MNYLLLLYQDENIWANKTDVEKTETLGAYYAYADALREAGAHIDGAPLEHSSTSKRVRANRVQDGPFADAKEQLGGFFLIDVENLDSALEWAARCPCASVGHVEVRPVWNIGE